MALPSAQLNLTPEQCEDIKKSWAVLYIDNYYEANLTEVPSNPSVSPFWGKFFDMFYTELFNRAPEVKYYFSPKTAMCVQAECLVCLMSHLVNRCDELRTGESRQELRRIGKAHHLSLLATNMYFIIAQTLINIIEQASIESGVVFSINTRRAWRIAISVLVDFMTGGKVKRRTVMCLFGDSYSHSAIDILTTFSSGPKTNFVTRAHTFFTHKLWEDSGKNKRRTVSLTGFSTSLINVSRYSGQEIK